MLPSDPFYKSVLIKESRKKCAVNNIITQVRARYPQSKVSPEIIQSVNNYRMFSASLFFVENSVLELKSIYSISIFLKVAKSGVGVTFGSGVGGRREERVNYYSNSNYQKTEIKKYNLILLEESLVRDLFLL